MPQNPTNAARQRFDPTNAERQARHRAKKRLEREALDAELATLRAEVATLRAQLARERNRRKKEIK